MSEKLKNLLKNYKVIIPLLIVGIVVLVGAIYFVINRQKIAVSPNESGAAGNGNTCTIAKKAGRSIYNFPAPDSNGPGCGGAGCWMASNTKWGKDQAKEGPYKFTLPAGTYKVTLQGYNDHTPYPDDQKQPREKYFVKLIDSSGTEIVRSSSTQDIPDTTSYVVNVVNQSLVVSRDATKIEAYHGAYPDNSGPNSISAVCAAFDQLSAPQTSPTLTVIKSVTNDNGGTSAASDFNIHVKSGGTTDVSGSPAAGSDTGKTYTLSAGTYVVSEDAHDGYGMTGITGDCASNGSITLVSGDAKTCTITNDDTPPDQATLTVIKAVTNDDEGNAGPGDFMIHVKKNGTDVTGSPAAGSSTGTTYTLALGTYVVSEDTTAGYTKEGITGDCSTAGSITLAQGDSKTCTITNNDNPPAGATTLTVIKHVINNNDGTKNAGDFTMNVIGSGASPASFPGDESGTTVTLNPGSYSVDEGAHAGYERTRSGGCTGTIAVGENKTCTITNDDDAPTQTTATLTVIKTVVKDDGGTAVAGDFNIHVKSGSTDVAGSPAAGSTTGTSYTLDAGTYVVSEDTQAGYTMTDIAGDCTGGGSVTLVAGDAKTCTITNDDDPLPAETRISIVKEVRNSTQNTAQADEIQANPGDTVEFVIVLTNTGDVSVYNVRMTDSLPSQLSYIPGTTTLDDAASADGIVTTGLTLGTFAAGQARTIRFQARVADAASFVAGTTRLMDIASAVADNTSPINDTAFVSVFIAGSTPTPTPSPTYSLSIQKFGANITKGESAEQAFVYARPGDSIRLFIHVRSQSSVALTNLIIRDVLPAGLAYVNGSTTINGLQTADGIAAGGITVSSLTPGAEAIATFLVTVNSAGYFSTNRTTLTNLAMAFTDQLHVEATLPIIVDLPCTTCAVVTINTGGGSIWLTIILGLLATLVWYLIEGAPNLYRNFMFAHGGTVARAPLWGSLTWKKIGRALLIAFAMASIFFALNAILTHTRTVDFEKTPPSGGASKLLQLFK
ncbi:MAG: hypothetical protein A3A33_04850 [Candidatus Yanofskybacteria bacterium RIFCSPLOWO2_01_FULL_49_25]|uniref:DUF11 domain-containing protein n=1 Tax=Candidatus Yanofskybacteria bacterium RIFCSPLOWO2_01_FULL_49_25 TaxID=1802701 RepID=A0A1F8GQB2_9BACT|nr:MAG: hypothetical protein A3A33_04850 [Candidatus Yanofskybacteria bacterium RIFCSPLOWO2_01_FULL_49_25]